MKGTLFAAGTLLVTALLSTGAVSSERFKQFRHDYDVLHQDLLNHEGEAVDVRNFVYTRDIATLTFIDGTLHFQRYVNGRPTTAIFIGNGRATITVPSHVERASLLSMTGDSAVDVSFTTCFIRFADDFDRAVKADRPVQKEKLRWKDFVKGSKETPGEEYFKPVVFHLYDNYFQLLRSLYERSADGYFWASFDRYVFTFDPNLPEEVRVAYALEEGSIVPADAVILQRQERQVYQDSLMSQIPYSLSIVEKDGRFEMGGIDETEIADGHGCLRAVVNADSLRFLSLFLDKHFTLKSLECSGTPTDFIRRKDFWFIGAILPTYAYRGDTLDLVFTYRGKDFRRPFPMTEDPRAVPHRLTLVSSHGTNFVLRDAGVGTLLASDRQQLAFVSSRSCSSYPFRVLVDGYDTTTIDCNPAVSVDIVHNRRVRSDHLRTAVDVAQTSFDDVGGLLGSPPDAEHCIVTWPGYNPLVAASEAVPPTTFYNPRGDYYFHHGSEAASHWFDKTLAGCTARESWLCDAIATYLALMVVDREVGSGALYENLLKRRDVLFKIRDWGHDIPIAAGSQVGGPLRLNKAIWLIHMLRWLMYDFESRSGERFDEFLRELAVSYAHPGFCNHDFTKIAEKYYGGSLTGFFDYWLYGTGMPRYRVDYAVEQREGGYYVSASVSDGSRCAAPTLPVVVRIAVAGKNYFERALVGGDHKELLFGPFDTRPDEFHFNEFFSILSQDEVNER